MRRVGFFTLGLIAAVALAARADQFPSRPQFQQWTVTGTAPGQTNTVQCNTSNSSGARCWAGRVGSTGSLTWTTASDAGAQENDGFALTRNTSGNFTGAIFDDAGPSGVQVAILGAANDQASIEFAANNVGIGSASFVCQAGNTNECVTGSATGDFAVRGASGVDISGNNGASIALKVDSANNITVPNAGSVPWQPAGTSGSATLTYSSGCGSGSSGASIAWQIIGKTAMVRVTSTSYCTTAAVASINWTGLPSALSSGMSGQRTVPCLGDTGTALGQAAECVFQTSGTLTLQATAGASLKSLLNTGTATFPID
jgi:hypothetical protein